MITRLLCWRLYRTYPEHSTIFGEIHLFLEISSLSSQQLSWLTQVLWLSLTKLTHEVILFGILDVPTSSSILLNEPQLYHKQLGKRFSWVFIRCIKYSWKQ